MNNLTNGWQEAKGIFKDLYSIVIQPYSAPILWRPMIPFLRLFILCSRLHAMERSVRRFRERLRCSFGRRRVSWKVFIRCRIKPVQQEEQQEHCRHDQNQPHIDFDKMSLLNRFFGSASFRIRGFVRNRFPYQM